MVYLSLSRVFPSFQTGLNEGEAEKWRGEVIFLSSNGSEEGMTKFPIRGCPTQKLLLRRFELTSEQRTSTGLNRKTETKKAALRTR